MITPIILAGGTGTRLWPLSRKAFPKQFTELTGSESLFQATARRLSGEQFNAPVVMTQSDFRFIAAEQLDAIEIEQSKIMIEPCGKNTAPAILAAALTLESTPDAIMMVCPSDHIVADETAFNAAVEAAAKKAAKGQLVTFGIRPTRPETGYGYLELAEALDSFEPNPVALQSFLEKPALKAAKSMVAENRFLWNAGIFMFKVDTIIRAFETYAPRMVAPVRAAVQTAREDLCFTRLDPKSWDRIEDISIDYAVMEVADNLSVVPMDCGWSDLGSWRSVWEDGDKDNDGNVAGVAATAINCKNTLLRSDDENVEVVGLGLDDITVVATGDAVLVAKSDQSEQVKDALANLKKKKIKQATEFNRCHRPWGYYETLSLGRRFQVKRIMVKPGAALSLQSHVHRAEHWVVVEGSANVTVDEDIKLISENQSVYIPLGAVHRLENPGKVPLHLIEVQSGAYLGEDDIVRYEDVYARTTGEAELA